MKKILESGAKHPYFQLGNHSKCWLRDPVKTITGPELVLEIFPLAASKICRFGGQLTSFYSLAQHVCGVRKRVQFLGGDAAQQLQALLHDAGEAFLGGDIPIPVRQCITGYDEIEESFINQIMAVFQLPTKIDPLVWRADKEMLAVEAAQHLDGGPIDNWTKVYVAGDVNLNTIRRSVFTHAEFVSPWDHRLARAKLAQELTSLSAVHFANIKRTLSSSH